MIRFYFVRKGMYRYAWVTKLASRFMQIHYMPELDTTAKRKRFASYLIRDIWVHVWQKYHVSLITEPNYLPNKMPDISDILILKLRGFSGRVDEATLEMLIQQAYQETISVLK